MHISTITPHIISHAKAKKQNKNTHPCKILRRNNTQKKGKLLHHYRGCFPARGLCDFQERCPTQLENHHSFARTQKDLISYTSQIYAYIIFKLLSHLFQLRRSVSYSLHLVFLSARPTTPPICVEYLS
jgi:hypothetical protein